MNEFEVELRPKQIPDDMMADLEMGDGEEGDDDGEEGDEDPRRSHGRLRKRIRRLTSQSQ